jgi:hypothetical protein
MPTPLWAAQIHAYPRGDQHARADEDFSLHARHSYQTAVLTATAPSSPPCGRVLGRADLRPRPTRRRAPLQRLRRRPAASTTACLQRWWVHAGGIRSCGMRYLLTTRPTSDEHSMTVTRERCAQGMPQYQRLGREVICHRSGAEAALIAVRQEGDRPRRHDQTVVVPIRWLPVTTPAQPVGTMRPCRRGV